MIRQVDLDTGTPAGSMAHLARRLRESIMTAKGDFHSASGKLGDSQEYARLCAASNVQGHIRRELQIE
jgi:hypothetical protein